MIQLSKAKATKKSIPRNRKNSGNNSIVNFDTACLTLSGSETIVITYETGIWLSNPDQQFRTYKTPGTEQYALCSWTRPGVRSNQSLDKDDAKMVAVDSNILTGILVVLSVLAYVFVLRRIKTKQPNPTDTATSTETCEEDMITGKKTEESQLSEEPTNSKPSTACGHHFGYLGSLPKRSILPRECIECDQMTKCISRKRKGRRKTRDQRIEAVLALEEETDALKNQ